MFSASTNSHFSSVWGLVLGSSLKRDFSAFCFNKLTLLEYCLTYPCLEKWLYLLEFLALQRLYKVFGINGFVLEKPQSPSDLSYDVLARCWGYLRKKSPTPCEAVLVCILTFLFHFQVHPLPISTSSYVHPFFFGETRTIISSNVRYGGTPYWLYSTFV